METIAMVLGAISVVTFIAFSSFKAIFTNRMDDLRKAQEEELNEILEAQRVKRQIDNEVDNDRLHSQRVRDKHKSNK